MSVLFRTGPRRPRGTSGGMVIQVIGVIGTARALSSILGHGQCHYAERPERVVLTPHAS